MSSTTQIYNPLRKYLMNGTIDLDTDDIKVALIASGYTFSAAHTHFADVSPNEVANGAGYTTGGKSLVGSLADFTGAIGKFSADNPVWTGLTKTFRYAVLYAYGVLNGVTDPLIACILLDNTPADVVVAGVDYTIQWNPSGIITLS